MAIVGIAKNSKYFTLGEENMSAYYAPYEQMNQPQTNLHFLLRAAGRPEPLVAPVQSAQRVGVVKVALEGKPMAEFPLIALREVPPASIFGRAWDTMRLWFVK